MSNKMEPSIRNAVSKAKRLAELKNQTFKEEEIFQMLLMRDTNEINSYLDELLFQAVVKCPIAHYIDIDQLYLVPCENITEKWIYILGEELISPDVYMLTVDQLHESCEWYKSLSVGESSYCKNVDTWTEFILTESLKKIRCHLDLLTSPITLWRDVFINEGEDLQKTLLTRAHSELNSLRKHVRVMKSKKAPEFLIHRHSEQISRSREIVRKIERVAFW